MDSVFGFKGKDFVCLVADTVFKHSILVLKECADRTVKIHEGQGMIVTGEDGDVLQFTDYIKHSLKLRSLRQGYTPTVKSSANFIRTELARAIREGPYNVYVITGGVDAAGPQLYYMDYLGTMGEDNFCVQGYSMYFLLSVMSEYWKPDMTKQDALALIKHCIDALGRRFLLQPTKFTASFIYHSLTEKEFIDYVPQSIDPTKQQLPNIM
ncbi:Proteasome subunit beta type 2 [Giardia lamblia P15]|uniref:Proteasome subunit beta n=1 Tax=Giardia intestinalis (strain P15) TaxID=658858 RepID=E1F2F0_GIAIA|nr:Proteasome subunit beta type 2 [Giardia lamblia P15]